MTYNRTNTDRVLFLSDIHLGVRTASTEWLENIQEYFDNFFIPLVKKYKNSGEKVLLVIAGDFFDNRQHIDINVLNIGADLMMKLSNVMEVFMIIGNHDIYKKKDIDISSLRLFKSFNNVNILSEISELTLKNNKKMTFIPWVGDHNEEMKLLSKQDSDFVVMHTEIAGLKFDNGREIIDGTSVESLKSGKIYSGHIHKRQESDRVVYLGAPYQLRRSDIGNTKGVYSLVFKEDGDVKQEFVENTYSSKFLRLKLGDILELKTSQLKEIVENNYVDIIVKKRHMNEINMSKLMEFMEECSTKKIEVILDKFDDDLVEQTSIEYSTDLSITDIFNANISAMEFNEEDRKELEEMNRRYLALATEALGGE